MRRILTILLLSSVLLPLSATGAPIYKWIDEDGRTHYSNQPPQSEQDTETLEFEAVVDDPERRLAAQQSLNDIVALAQQWEADRLARQRQQREDRLSALEAAYYERMLKEPDPVAEDEPDRERVHYAPYNPYYRSYPYPYRHRSHAGHHRRHRPGFGLSIELNKGQYTKHRPGRPVKHKGSRRPEPAHANRRARVAKPRSVGLAN